MSCRSVSHQRFLQYTGFINVPKRRNILLGRKCTDGVCVSTGLRFGQPKPVTTNDHRDRKHVLATPDSELRKKLDKLTYDVNVMMRHIILFCAPLRTHPPSSSISSLPSSNSGIANLSTANLDFLLTQRSIANLAEKPYYI
jgi:hypothetical protein